MEVLLSAVATDLVGRLLSFLISERQEPAAADGARLQRALQRARVVLEEAEGRQVTSLAMLLQLRNLRWEMCRAAHALDALRIRAAAAGRRHRFLRQSLLLLSSSDSLGGGGGDGTVMASLEAALSDAKELVVLLGGCPRLTRQPYSAYLFMERCMFGRQMEMEQIIDFLLRPACSLAGDPNPGVLPVVGGREVGKRTLVEHVCIHERVRQYFAKILRLSSDDLMAAGDHDDEHRSLGIDPSARSLVVVDLVGDVEEEPWRRLCSSVRRESGDSKVVIICRKAEHATRLGTAPRPVTLARLRRTELWYFFRALAFGGADPEDRPEMVAIAAEIFAGICDVTPSPFTAVNSAAMLLRADMTLRSWRRVARVVWVVESWSRGSRFPELQLGDAHGVREHSREKNGLFILRPSMDAPHCLFYDYRKLAATTPDSQLPTVTTQDLVAGRVVPGVDTPRFNALLWRSPIPPYCSYAITCEIDGNQQTAASSAREQLGRRPGEILELERLKKKRLADEPS